MTLRLILSTGLFQGVAEGQNPMTRAQVAVDMLCLSVNGILEFKEGPSLEEVKAYFQI